MKFSLNIYLNNSAFNTTRLAADPVSMGFAYGPELARILRDSADNFEEEYNMEVGAEIFATPTATLAAIML